MADTQYIVPVPADPNTIVAVNDGNRWIQNILPGSIQVFPSHISFLAMWTAGKDRKPRRFTLARDMVGGYQTDEG